jgi:predicted nucleic acid-binding protein
VIVADINVIGYLLIPGPLTASAEAAARKDQWCSTPLWRSEFRNVLALYLRRQALTIEDARSLIAVAERLLWGREFVVRSALVLDCIASSNRSAYDCEFVALAKDLGLPLVTSDETIIRDFPRTAIHLRDFVRA